MRLLLLASLSAASVAGVARGVPTAAVECQRAVDAAPDVSFPYSHRGDRCEGVYDEPLFSSPVHVLGFGPPPPTGSQPLRDAVTIRWQAQPSDTVSVRSELVRTRAYYQMDTRVPPGSDGFEWSLAVAAAAGHEVSEFDLACWTQASVARRRVALLVPCRFDAQGMTGGPLQLRLATGEPLRAASFSLTRLGRPEGEDVPLVTDRALGGPYGTGYLLRIPVGELRPGAVYRLSVRCTMLNGAPHTEDYWLRAS
jgi:hypothetical protein